jgi:epoxide hydrolase-like predicted phosphatase
VSTCKISTIIFDAGGVLLYINRRRNDIARNLLLSVGYDNEVINRALKAGEDFDEKYFRNNRDISNWKEEKNWLRGHYNAIANAVDERNECLGDKLFMLTFDTYEYILYPETIELLENLKNHYKLGILSNALPSLDWAFDNLGIRKYFDNIIISAYEGIEKPNKEIYITAVERLESKFEECIFIDDRIENVKTAESLGIRAFHLNREKDTLKVLLELLESEFSVA